VGAAILIAVTRVVMCERAAPHLNAFQPFLPTTSIHLIVQVVTNAISIQTAGEKPNTFRELLALRATTGLTFLIEIP